MNITIFDYDITTEELKLLFVLNTEKENYIENTTEKKKMRDLYLLFKLREDTIRAGEISSKIFKKKLQVSVSY